MPPPTASLSYSGSPFVFTQGTAITPLVPTASQGLSMFTVSPALPAGLSFDTANGTISGTPTALSPAATYTVSASGGGASSSATVSITVNAVPPSALSYGSAAFTFTTNVAARNLTPTAKGGAITGWSISPALPAGLTFDTSSGAISGTPTTASAAGSYLITAQNSGGQATVSLAIEIDDGPLLELGHNAGISLVRASGSSVLSLDVAGHWVLWDYTSGTLIASGDLYCAPNCNQPHLADLAGGTLVLETKTGFEVRSAINGQVLSSITFQASSNFWWSLASDGSYLDAGSSAGLSAWSPSGTSLFSLSGNYAQAIAFSDPGEIQIGAGAAGQNVIQTVAVPSGTSTTGPSFSGTFGSWFLDGSRFITIATTTAMVYSQGSVQEAVITFPGTAPLVGQGNWIWTLNGGSVEVFAIVSGSTPAATFPSGSAELPSGTSVAVTTSGTGMGVIDLSGTTPSETSYTVPITGNWGAYAAFSASQWMLANNQGVLLDGASLGSTPRYFGYGEALSIAGSSGSIAVATASDRIVYFDASTLAQEGVISATASHVLLSSDGSVLAAQEDDGSIGIYSLPAASLVYTWTYPAGESANGIGLSASGTSMTQVIYPASNDIMLQAVPATGGAPSFTVTVVETSSDSYTLYPKILGSPDGTMIATTAGLLYAAPPNPGMNLWKSNGTLITGEMAYPVGWIDDGHLLANTYTGGGGGRMAYAACSVYSPTGQSTGACSLPNEVTAFQGITSDTIYAVNLAEILSVSTGNVSWTSGDTASDTFACPCSAAERTSAVGAVADNRVVFVSGTQVLAQGY